jgi:hypothetical protein
MSGLTKREIYKVVNEYIGVNAGYLGDFSYRTHEEFYSQYCDLDVDIDRYRPGTTREVFIRILEAAPTMDQARILRGVLEKYPVDSFPSPSRDKKTQLRQDINELIRRLETGVPVPSPDLGTSSEVVRRAIADTEVLLRSNGPISGLDRIHTSLHGYLLALCRGANLQVTKDPSATELLKTLIKLHPGLQARTARKGDTESVLRAIGVILDALNPIRNRGSVAHPNDTLLEEPEAMLVVNAARTVLHYLDARLGKTS